MMLPDEDVSWPRLKIVALCSDWGIVPLWTQTFPISAGKLTSGGAASVNSSTFSRFSREGSQSFPVALNADRCIGWLDITVLPMCLTTRESVSYSARLRQLSASPRRGIVQNQALTMADLQIFPNASNAEKAIS
jgi:hypothetical protein